MKVLLEARRALFLAVLFSGVAAHGAHAATLISPYSYRSMGCMIVNVGTKDITAKIEILDFNGAVLHEGDRLVPPGGARDVFQTISNTGGYCRFSGDFSKKKVRASLNDSEGAVVLAQ
jgi:hypothetical protein